MAIPMNWRGPILRSLYEVSSDFPLLAFGATAAMETGGIRVGDSPVRSKEPGHPNEMPNPQVTLLQGELETDLEDSCSTGGPLVG